MSDEETELSIKDRIFLANQYLILEKLYPEDAASFRERRTIVENGYELDYDDIYSSVDKHGLSRARCEWVMDILDMYSSLCNSHSRLQDKSRIERSGIQFMGFDGNNATEELGYARFLVLEQGRWQDVLEGRPGFDLNSHSPVEEEYERMLTVWTNLGRKHTLTENEIQQILNARPYPGETQ